MNNIKKYFSKFYAWLGWRNRREYNYNRLVYLLKNLIIFIISFIALLYSSKQFSNYFLLPLIVIGFAVYFGIKSFYFFCKECKNWHSRQINLIKILSIIGLILLLFWVYNERMIFKEKFNDFYENKLPVLDVSKFNISTEENSGNNVNSKSNNPDNQSSDLVGSVGKFFHIEPLDSSKIENLIYEQTNEARKENGLPPLRYDSQLSTLARSHSQDMLDNNFFDHTNLQGEDPTDRAKRMGVQYIVDFGSYEQVGIGENIGNTPVATNVEGCGITNSEGLLSDCAMTGWLNSPGHRANILDSSYNVLGVGVACDNFECMLTQDFR